MKKQCNTGQTALERANEKRQEEQAGLVLILNDKMGNAQSTPSQKL